MAGNFSKLVLEEKETNFHYWSADACMITLT